MRVRLERGDVTLAELGRTSQGMKYDTIGNGQFELTARSGATFLRYKSDEAPDSLLRSSLRRLGAVPR